MSDYIKVIDELLMLGGLKRTCVEIPEDQFLGYFGLFYEIQFHSCVFNHGLIVFDGSIGVPMRNYFEIGMFLC